jgi:hypothetical protein
VSRCSVICRDGRIVSLDICHKMAEHYLNVNETPVTYDIVIYGYNLSMTVTV